MKKLLKSLPLLLFFISAITLLTTSCKEEIKHDGFIISGKVKGLNSGYIKLTKVDYTDRENNPKVIDSSHITEGRFEFIGKVDNIDMIHLNINDKYHTLRGFFLENTPITINIDVAKADNYGQFEPAVTGSKMQDIYAQQELKDQSIMTNEKYAPLITLREEMSLAYALKDETLIKQYKEKADSFQALANERQRAYQDSKVNYVLKNPDSPVSPYVLSFQFSEGRMSKDRMKEVYKAFTGNAKKTAMYAYFKKTYTEIFESLSIGSTAPDFTLKSIEGKNVKLSSVKAKYKLVDFWASWCVPCRASFPHLKALRQKYAKDGFEIIGIGTADEEIKWRKAIEEDQTPWIHLFDPAYGAIKGKSPYGEVSKMYGVPFLPTTFLMDGNQKIILRNPSKKELDVKLEELFGY